MSNYWSGGGYGGPTEEETLDADWLRRQRQGESDGGPTGNLDPTDPEGDTAVYRPEDKLINGFTQEQWGNYLNAWRGMQGKAANPVTKEAPTGGYMRPQETFSGATGTGVDMDGNPVGTGHKSLGRNIPDNPAEMVAARPDLLGADAAPNRQFAVNKSSNTAPTSSGPPEVSGFGRAGANNLQNMVTVGNAMGRAKARQPAPAPQQAQQQAIAGELRNG
jgi:hypothetical protein